MGSNIRPAQSEWYAGTSTDPSKLYVSSQVIQEQNALDEKVKALVDAMHRSCDFVESADDLRRRSERQNLTIIRILQQVTQCAYFVREYCRDERFGKQTRCVMYDHRANLCSAKRALKHIISGVEAQVRDYLGILRELRRSFVDDAVVLCTVKVYQVFDDIEAMQKVLNDIGMFASGCSIIVCLIHG